MLREVAIRGYQSLQSISLKLGKITVVTGHTDAGKSSLVRALVRACYNDSGYAFLTSLNKQVASKSQVAIKTDRGVVIWSRTKTTVKYKTIIDGKEITYTKLGRGFVPEEVIEVLGIHPIRVDTGTGATAFQRVQFSGQFDLPFLVADRGGVAASRLLGRLTGVNVFSTANKRLSIQKNGLTSVLTDLRQQNIDKLDELKPYEGLENKQSQLEKLKIRLAKVQVCQNRLDGFKQISIRLQSTRSALKIVSGQQVGKLLNILEELAPSLVILWNKLSAQTYLVKLKQQLSDIHSEVGELTRVLVPPDFNLIPKMIRCEGLCDLKSRFQQLDRDQSLVNVDIEQTNTNLSCVEVDLTQMEEKFPLCPFTSQFSEQRGVYRCFDIMKVIGGESGNG